MFCSGRAGRLCYGRVRGQWGAVVPAGGGAATGAATGAVAGGSGSAASGAEPPVGTVGAAIGAMSGGSVVAVGLGGPAGVTGVSTGTLVAVGASAVGSVLGVLGVSVPTGGSGAGGGSSGSTDDVPACMVHTLLLMLSDCRLRRGRRPCCVSKDLSPTAVQPLICATAGKSERTLLYVNDRMLHNYAYGTTRLATTVRMHKLD